MQKRKLGQNNLEVSAIGLGCMGMSDFYGPADHRTNLAVLNRALDIGVNFLDTAPCLVCYERKHELGSGATGVDSN